MIKHRAKNMKLINKLAISTLATGISLAMIGGPTLASSYSPAAIEAQKEYKQNHYEYQSKIDTYNQNGDYFNSSSKDFLDVTSGRDRINDNYGIVMIAYSDVYSYNPVTMAQYALINYGRYYKTGNISNRREFLKYADALIRLQGTDGALRYNFPFTKDYLHVHYRPGWVSAMAQGQALSVYSRAYRLTHDVKYLQAGKMALAFLDTPISKGGTLTTLEQLNKKYRKGNYFWYEEYISKPNNYTLNGYMFTLFGLYDWYKVTSPADMGQKEAKRMFGFGIRSLVEVLPMYDIGGFTSYDLSGITFHQAPHIVPSYHEVHIYELYGLYSITKNTTILSYYKLWSSYVK